MKKSVGYWQMCGFVFTSLCGTLLHFLYDLTGAALWSALFSGVNESTWEHMKLLFFPMLAFAAVQSFFFKEQSNFWCIKLKGTLTGLALIPLIFYTYNGVIGKSPDWVNIAIFFIAAAIAYVSEARSFKSTRTECFIPPKAALALLLIIAVLFAVFTFATPRLAIFADPLTGDYGISKAV